jgi:hypothetical protein
MILMPTSYRLLRGEFSLSGDWFEVSEAVSARAIGSLAEEVGMCPAAFKDNSLFL